MSLRYKFIAYFAPFLLFIIFNISQNIYLSFSKINQAELTLEVTELSKKITDIMHEAQKERGNTSLFNNDPTYDKNLLNQQRQLLDQQITNYHDFIEKKIKHSLKNKRITDEIKVFNNFLESLVPLREKILKKEISNQEAIKAYSKICNYIQLITETISSVILDPEQSEKYNAFRELSSIKEFAGKERAMGAAGFGSGSFKPNVYRNFIILGGQQDAIWYNLEKSADPMLYKNITSTFNTKTLDTIKALRSKAIKSVEENIPLNVTGKEWFDSATKYINSIRATEVSFVDQLIAISQENIQHAYYMIYVLLGALVIALGLIGNMMHFIFNKVSKPIKYYAEVMKEIAESNTNQDIKPINSKDEIGSIYQNLIVLKKTTTNALMLESSVNSVTSAVMLLNLDGVITYTNPACELLFKSFLDALGEKGKSVAKLQNLKINNLSLRNENVFEKLIKARKFMLQAGGVFLECSASDVKDINGCTIAYVIEWSNRIQEMKVQQEIASIVESAAEGELSQRLSIDDKRDGNRELSENINLFLDTIECFIDEASGVAQNLAKGNLCSRLDGIYFGKFEALQDNLNFMGEKISETIAVFKESVKVVLEKAYAMEENANQLQQRTEQQASELEETAASMEEIASTVRQTSESVLEAANQSEDTKKNSESGQQIVTQAVDAMEKISNSSKDISVIINLIDEIAFQTNLLALNAAVEASRAGDAGRGFAVVADEVRSLAQRSANASTDIKKLIDESAVNVKNGVEYVSNTGEALDKITNAAIELSKIINSISNSASEQSSGIDQINVAVSRMDQVTQQNSGLVNETNATSKSLTSEMNKLEEAISFFK